jgi:hypothetical protein
MKKYVLPLILSACAAVLIPVAFDVSRSPTNAAPSFVNALEPAAGDNIELAAADSAKGLELPEDTMIIDQTKKSDDAQTVPQDTPAAITPAATVSGITPIDEDKLIDAEEPPILEDQETKDAAETPPLRLTPDKPHVVHLERNAVNILVGNGDHLRAVPDTNKTVVLIPKRPGSTYFQALDAQGKIIMQRHVIVAAPQSQYIRVRRACINGDTACREFTVYHCPDMCHEVSVMNAERAAAPALPEVPTGSGASPTAAAPVMMDPAPSATPIVTEPPPGQ